MERIELDYAGWKGWPRYTHYPTGDTLLRKPYMSDEQWAEAKISYFLKYPGVKVLDEEGKEI